MRSDRAIVLGEVLCDMFAAEAGVRLMDAPALLPCLGGAPANVAVQLARLGKKAAVISAVGDDPMGARLTAELTREGVGVEMIRRRTDAKTGMTLVEVDTDGERRFYGYLERSADLTISPDDIDEACIANAPLFHHGTVVLRGALPRAATQKAIDAARRGRAIVSLDFNLRYGMFPDREELLGFARAQAKQADIVKTTEDEAKDLYGDGSLDALADRVHAEGASLVFLTLGPKGALISSRRARVRVEAPQARAVDATGAGDSFMGGALSVVLERMIARDDLASLEGDVLERIGVRACHTGSLTVTALGATTAMPRSAP